MITLKFLFAMNFTAKAPNFIANETNTTAMVPNSGADGTKSTAKATNSIVKK